MKTISASSTQKFRRYSENMSAGFSLRPSQSPQWSIFSLFFLILLPRHMNSFTHINWNSRGRGPSLNAPSIGSIFSTDGTTDVYSAPSSERRTYENSIKFKTRLSSEDELRCLQMVEEHRRISSIKEDSRSFELDKAQWASLANVKDADEIDRIIFRGNEARHKLMEHNMGLVHYVVSKHFYSSALGYDDLIQEGVFGLAVALEKYNHSIATNSTFGTYAYYWIRASVSRAVASHGAKDLIRIPEHVSLAISKIQKACQRLGLDCDLMDDTSIRTSSLLRDPSREKALALEAGLTVKQLKEALLVANRRKMGGYVEIQPWFKAASVLEEQEDVKGREFWVEAFGKFLRPKELEALGLRYGLWPTSSDTAHGSPRLASYPKPFRDYEAEAEEALFGKSSVLFSSEEQRSITSNVKEDKSDDYIVKKGRWGEAMSFQEIAKNMQISREYGRRLCTSALDKLRQAAQNGQLQPDIIYL